MGRGDRGAGSAGKSCSNGGVERPAQVIDILGLWGDASDKHPPGVPGIGEKTASKLITQYGSVENLLTHTAELKGKLKENLENLSRAGAALQTAGHHQLRSAVSVQGGRSQNCRNPTMGPCESCASSLSFNSIGKAVVSARISGRGRGFEPTTFGGTSDQGTRDRGD